MSAKIGRNDPCHCGSGNKYKKCCLSKDQERERVLSNISASSLEGAVPLPSPKTPPPSVVTTKLPEDKLQYVEETMAQFEESMKTADAKQLQSQLKTIQELLKLQR